MTRDTVHEGHEASEDHSKVGVGSQWEPQCRANSVHLMNDAEEEMSEAAKLDPRKVGTFSIPGGIVPGLRTGLNPPVIGTNAGGA